MKRIFALLLALMLLCTLVASCSKDEDEDEQTDLTVVTEHQVYTPANNQYKDSFEYEIINGDEVAIVNFTSNYTLHAIVIPDKIENCPVVEITDGAFYQCSQITSVKIPATVTRIGDMAFAGCVQLEEVIFDGVPTLQTIDDYAFAKCAALKSIALPETLTKLGEGAFMDCITLVTVLTQAPLTEIMPRTFMGCAKLYSVTAFSQVEIIGEFAFSGCTELAIFHPASVKEIRAYSFAGCKRIDPLTPIEGLLKVDKTAFY
ncbi:MAG: leucine-rich repeat domain-containing protein [Clostridia bacterium]|nr:leucine-rich repeat domain-containing protein [Clostridia bacterium]